MLLGSSWISRLEKYIILHLYLGYQPKPNPFFSVFFWGSLGACRLSQQGHACRAATEMSTLVPPQRKVQRWRFAQPDGNVFSGERMWPFLQIYSFPHPPKVLLKGAFPTLDPGKTRLKKKNKQTLLFKRFREAQHVVILPHVSTHTREKAQLTIASASCEKADCFFGVAGFCSSWSDGGELENPKKRVIKKLKI